MRPPRFTLRQLLALVAFVALLLGAGRMWSRSKRYRLKAEFHARQERLHGQNARRDLGFSRWASGSAKDHAVKAAEAAEEAERARALLEGTGPDPLAAFLRDLAYRQWKCAEMGVRFNKRVSLDDEESAAHFRAYAEREGRLAAHHAFLERKYRYAASRPWITVTPDPPEPPSSY